MYVGIEEIREAAKRLSPSGLKLYLYLAENENEWMFNLFPKNFQRAYDVAESTYRKAKKELIEKGYIVEGEGNAFTFYTAPEESRISLEDLRKELNKVAIRIKMYDVNLYDSFNAETYKMKDLTEKEKIAAGLELLRRMKLRLLELEEKNSDFGF